MYTGTMRIPVSVTERIVMAKVSVQGDIMSVARQKTATRWPSAQTLSAFAHSITFARTQLIHCYYVMRLMLEQRVKLP